MASDGVGKSVIFLTIFVALNTTALVVVSFLQFSNMKSLQLQDSDLQSDLELLLHDGEHGVSLVFELSSGVKRDVAESLARSRRSGLEDVFLSLLQTEERVIERHCKNTTKVCKQGEKGETGAPGQQGTKGDKGVAGLKGDEGYQGPEGDKGTSGPPGEVGAVGATGLIGTPGAVGLPGEKGDQGLQGVRGRKGEAGSPGVKGDAGERGAQGITGQAGSKGEAGSTGVDGDPGVAGVKGETGDVGVRGGDADKLKGGCECLKKPSIFGPDSEKLVVPYGGAATLNCSSSGVPPPDITWVGNGNKAISYTIPVVTSFDYHTYQCVASNVFGTDTKNITISRT
ncbi:collagen alpha-1(XXV) chain-like [Haliotis rubra]|uniref:collagen alpha-1(XXV) chain-like n=1 Tax=Haliotis rubra TaxID=36100 RepID=UPI001EE567DF|nr:collagen alpha-1(XXV) chain-like [Haliotis rubra]